MVSPFRLQACHMSEPVGVGCQKLRWCEALINHSQLDRRSVYCNQKWARHVWKGNDGLSWGEIWKTIPKTVVYTCHCALESTYHLRVADFMQDERVD